MKDRFLFRGKRVALGQLYDPMPNTQKQCKDCRYSLENMNRLMGQLCKKNPKSVWRGIPDYHSCSAARAFPEICGPSAKNFKPKQKQEG